MPLNPLNNSDRRPSTEDSILAGRSFEQESGRNSLISLLKGGTEAAESKEKDPIDGQNTLSWFALFSELFRNVKDNLEKIKSFVQSTTA